VSPVKYELGLYVTEDDILQEHSLFTSSTLDMGPTKSSYLLGSWVLLCGDIERGPGAGGWRKWLRRERGELSTALNLVPR
jgi:hypothetical protein